MKILVFVAILVVFFALSASAYMGQTDPPPAQGELGANAGTAQTEPQAPAGAPSKAPGSNAGQVQHQAPSNAPANLVPKSPAPIKETPYWQTRDGQEEAARRILADKEAKAALVEISRMCKHPSYKNQRRVDILRKKVAARTSVLVRYNLTVSEFTRILMRTGYFGPTSGWAEADVQQVLSSGLMVGRHKGTDIDSNDWKKPTTRQETAVVANRVSKYAYSLYDQILLLIAGLVIIAAFVGAAIVILR